MARRVCRTVWYMCREIPSGDGTAPAEGGAEDSASPKRKRRFALAGARGRLPPFYWYTYCVLVSDQRRVLRG
jgi:hypothetical protein